MAIKYREAKELRQTTRENLAKSVENWTRFLKTAGNTYKYNYSDGTVPKCNSRCVIRFVVGTFRQENKKR